MTRALKLASIFDLYEKLQRDGAALDDEVTVERVFNFAATAYSLIEWIKNDPAVSPLVKTQAAIDALSNDQWIKLCGDLITARKHFKLKRVSTARLGSPSREIGSASVKEGHYEDGKGKSEILLSDGTKFHSHDLVENVLSSWKSFFSRNGMPMRAIRHFK